jgi:hypothetical protein
VSPSTLIPAARLANDGEFSGSEWGAEPMADGRRRAHAGRCCQGSVCQDEARAGASRRSDPTSEALPRVRATDPLGSMEGALNEYAERTWTHPTAHPALQPGDGAAARVPEQVASRAFLRRDGAAARIAEEVASRTFQPGHREATSEAGRSPCWKLRRQPYRHAAIPIRPRPAAPSGSLNIRQPEHP